MPRAARFNDHEGDKVVLIDRDGVVNYDRPDYILEVSQFRFIHGSERAIRLLTQSGYQVHIVSNQSAVGRGLMTQATLDEITAYMLARFEKAGAHIESVSYCTHTPDDHCDCRKPKTGLIDALIDKYGFNPARAWFVGDNLTDMTAGNAAGCRTILIARQLPPSKFHTNDQAIPDFITTDLYTAVTSIILRV
ncbi:MAG: HAD family hydrolase [Verrucomicrobia bacterium]|nr:HAD family hydrolase [Verrucomicrobiota bacterium]